MKLLIITQKIDINDDNLGFFVRWVEEFAKNAEEVFVIANFIGGHNLPDNVKIFSLGKESKLGRVRRYLNFYRYLIKILPKSDKVFVHMIPLWVLMGWPLYKIFRKKVYLWYTHKSITLTLRVAEKMVKKIFTASKKSFRMQSDKVMVMGHGIDIEKFKSSSELSEDSKKFRIITAGRVSKAKKLDILIGAASILKNNGEDFEIQIAGTPIMKNDKEYFEELKKRIKEKNLEDRVSFVGAIPYKDIEKFYQAGDLFINLSSTGSMDKAVLEAMASGVNVLTSNEAFFDILPEKNLIQELSVQSLAEKIQYFIQNDVVSEHSLRKIVAKNHSLSSLISKLVQHFNND